MPSPFFNSPYGHVKPPLMHALSFKRKKSHVASVAAAAVLKAFASPRGKNVLVRQTVKYRNMFHSGQGLVRERQPGEQVTPEKGWLTDEEEESEGGEEAVPVAINLADIQEFEVENELMEEPEMLVVAVEEPAPLDHIHDEEDVVKNDLLKLEISLSESTNLEVKNLAGSPAEHAMTILAETHAPLVISTVDTNDTTPEDDPVVEDTNTEQVEELSPETRSIVEVVLIAEIPIETEEAVPQPHTVHLVEQPQPEQSISTTALSIEGSIPLDLSSESIQLPLPKLVLSPQVEVMESIERGSLLEIENTQDTIRHQEQEIESKQEIDTASELQEIEIVPSEEVLEVKSNETVEELLSIEIAEPTPQVLQSEVHVPESTPNPTPDVKEENETDRIFDVAPSLCIEVATHPPSEVALVAFSEKHSEQLFDDKESSCTETELNEDEDSEDIDENTHQEFEGRLESTPSHVFKLILPIPPSVKSHAPSTVALSIRPEHTLEDLQKQVELEIPQCHITFTTLDIEPDCITDLSKSGPTDYVLKPYDGDGLHVTRSVNMPTCWSLSTGVHSFIGDASKTRYFNINISTSPTKPPSTIIRISLPSFTNRTTYLRSELRSLAPDLVGLTNLKLECDAVAYRSVQQRSMLTLVTSAFVCLTLPLLLITVIHFSQPTLLVESPLQWDFKDLYPVITYLFLAFSDMLLLAGFTYMWSAYHSTVQGHAPDLAELRKVYLERGFDLVKWETLQKEDKRIRNEVRKLAAEYGVTDDGGVEGTGRDSLAATAA